MKKYKVDLEVKGLADLEKANEELDKVEQSQGDIAEGSAEMSGALDSATGGMVSKFAALKTSVISSVKSFGLLKAAIAATGIGLLLLAFASLKAAFTSTEEGQNKLNKIMNAFGVITGNIIDLMAKLGDGIIAVFEDPKQALIDFKTLIIENVQNRIDAVIKLFGFLGSAVKKVFSGDFAGAMDDAKMAGSALIDVSTGVENTLGKVAGAITKIVEETKEEIKISNELSDLQARNDKLTRTQLVARAKLEGEIADLKLQAEQANLFSIAEREAALRRALELTNEIFAREEEIAANALRIQRERNKLSGSTAEDLMLEAQLEADLILLQKQRADASKEMTTKMIGLSNQRIAQAEAERQKIFGDLQSETDAELDALIATFEDAGDAIEEIGKISAEEIAGLAAAGIQTTSSFIKMLAEEVDVSTKKGFEENKKLRLAGIIADTLAASVAGFLAGLQTGNPIAGAITAASALAFGAIQYDKLKQTTFEGGSSPSSSTPQATAAAPSSSLITPLSADAAQASVSTAPARAYVVSSDVTSGSALDRAAQSTANF